MMFRTLGLPVTSLARLGRNNKNDTTFVALLQQLCNISFNTVAVLFGMMIFQKPPVWYYIH